MKSFVFDKTTGDFAVGTIVVTSLALSVHSFVNIHPFLKFYSVTSAWKLFMSLPLLILTYLIGTIITIISSSLFNWINGDTMKARVERMYVLGISNNQYLVDVHDKFAQKIEILGLGSNIGHFPLVPTLCVGTYKPSIPTQSVGTRSKMGSAL